MAAYTGTPSNDYIDAYNLNPSGRTNAYFMYGRDGHDTMFGGALDDFLMGENGNDTLHGRAGADTIIGGPGADKSYGGAGNDSILDDIGNDTLAGGTGDDRLWGAWGNDRYDYYSGDGFDIINDNRTSTGGVGGGGIDTLYFRFNSSQDTFLTSGNDLFVTTIADVADGTMDAGIQIEGYLLGGNYKIEYIDLLDGIFLMPTY